MRPPTFYFLLVASAIALVQQTNAAKMRNIKLHGYGTGTVNADPLNLDFMGMPVTLGGKGQGDVKGAVEVAIPSSGGLEQYFSGNSAPDFTNDRSFYGSYPDWLKHHSRYIAGEDVYGIKPLDSLRPSRVHKNVQGIILKGGPSSRSSSGSPKLQPLQILNPGGQGGAMYMLPLHTVHK